MNIDERIPNLNQAELRSLVTDESLFIFPIRAQKDHVKAEDLTTLQYLQKLRLLFSLTIWSLN